MPAPFPLDTADYSTAAALYFANASDLAYSDDPAPAARDLLGLDAVPFRDDATDTQGFAGRGDGFAVLAFRGSEQIDQHPADWINDADALQVTQDPFTGRVHQGFSRAVTGAWSVLTPVLRQALSAGAAVGADDPGVPLFVTGHSLGGALALLATCRLVSGQLPASGADPAIRFNLRATYTFGAPRVGDPNFCGAYRVPPPTYRVVNNLDIVPLLPLRGGEGEQLLDRLPAFLIPAGIRSLLERAATAGVYGDVGQLAHLDADGAVALGGERPDWALAYLVQSIRSFRRSLNAPVTDHFIDSYIRALSG